MPYGFLDIAATPGVKTAQETNGSAGFWSNFHGERIYDRFTEAEIAFITERDSFYMATVGENGWPYVQHRGGPPGFLRVLTKRLWPSPTSVATVSTSALATCQRMIAQALFWWIITHVVA